MKWTISDDFKTFHSAGIASRARKNAKGLSCLCPDVNNGGYTRWENVRSTGTTVEELNADPLSVQNWREYSVKDAKSLFCPAGVRVAVLVKCSAPLAKQRSKPSFVLRSFLKSGFLFAQLILPKNAPAMNDFSERILKLSLSSPVSHSGRS